MYYYINDANMFASEKTAKGYPMVIALSVFMILMIIWSCWRVVWDINFLVGKFKGTLLYLEFADHDYAGEE